MVKNKRGQGLSTNTIILLILGIVILVVLILGFTIGWDKLAPWLSSNNVDAIVNQCGVACSTGSTYDFCKDRTLKTDDDSFPGVNCEILSGEEYKSYGIAACPTIDCEEKTE